MNIVLNSVRINAPVETVFALVTSARLWPAWHPSTIEVGGVTERPYLLGDEVRQVAQIGGRIRTGTWTVTEHVPSAVVTLQMYGGEIEICYSFVALEGCTQVIRRLAYTAMLVDSGHDLDAFEQLMHAESALGLEQLKVLIEEIVRRGAA